MNQSKKSACRIMAASAVLLSVAACGGGDGSYSTAYPSPTPAVNTLSGTAAVGSPIVGGTVKIICSAGPANATVTTNSTGAWQASVTGQTLPCAVQVSGGTIRGNANTTPYHALTLGFGVVNLTPLTDLLVANQAASATPATWFTALGTSTTPLQSFTQAQADAALTKLRAALGSLAPLATVNPVTTPFTAAPGNTSDDILSSLQIALTNLSLSYTSLLGNAAGSAFTPPTGFGAAIGTAYLTTPSGTPAVAIAPAPTNVQVAVTSQSQLNLTWTAATGATSYNVYRSTSPSVQLTAGNKIATSTTATSLQDTGLTASTAYYYKVTAVNSAGESVGSAEVTGTTQAPAAVVPVAPTGLSATAASASQINLAWTAVSGATGYNVYRSTTANVAITAGNKLTTTATTGASYSDSTGLAAATAYFYKVTALNAAGESASGSNEVTATTASTTVTGGGSFGTATAIPFVGLYASLAGNHDADVSACVKDAPVNNSSGLIDTSKGTSISNVKFSIGSDGAFTFNGVADTGLVGGFNVFTQSMPAVEEVVYSGKVYLTTQANGVNGIRVVQSDGKYTVCNLNSAAFAQYRSVAVSNRLKTIFGNGFTVVCGSKTVVVTSEGLVGVNGGAPKAFDFGTENTSTFFPSGATYTERRFFDESGGVVTGPSNSFNVALYMPVTLGSGTMSIDVTSLAITGVTLGASACTPAK